MSNPYGQTGAVNLSAATNQNKYKGMIKVLPTHPPQRSPSLRASFPNGSGATNGGGSVDHHGIFPNHRIYQRVQNTDAISSRKEHITAPRLPPPPKTSKVNNSQRMGRLGNQGRSDLHTSVQDLSQFNPSLEMSPSSGLTSRQSYNLSATDFREIRTISPNPQQTVMKTLPIDQSNRPAEHQTFKSAPNQQQMVSSVSSMQAASPAQSVIHIKKQTNSEMSCLHDELVKLRLELAAMKDPMIEHEEWLKNQSVQVKELEEMQKQLQSNMVVNKKQESKLKEGLTHKESPMVYKTKITAPPTAVLMPKPTTKVRPPILSPKPISNTKVKTTSFRFPETPSAEPKSAMTGGDARESKRNNDQPKEEISDYTNLAEFRSVAANSVEKSEKISSSSDVKVKRISQLFEANSSNLEEKPTQRSTVHFDAKTKNGTIRKLHPSLLSTIQASEEAKISSVPKPSNVSVSKEEPIQMRKKSVAYLAQQTSRLSYPVAAPNVSRSPSFLKHATFQSVLPPTSKFSAPSAKPVIPNPQVPLPIPKPTNVSRSPSFSKHATFQSVLPPTSKVPPPSPKPVIPKPQVPPPSPKPSISKTQVPPPSPKPEISKPQVPSPSSKQIRLSSDETSNVPLTSIKPETSASNRVVSPNYNSSNISVTLTFPSVESSSTPELINNIPKIESPSPEVLTSAQYHRYENIDYYEIETPLTSELGNESYPSHSSAEPSFPESSYDDSYTPPLLSPKDFQTEEQCSLSISKPSSSTTTHLAATSQVLRPTTPPPPPPNKGPPSSPPSSQRLSQIPETSPQSEFVSANLHNPTPVVPSALHVSDSAEISSLSSESGSSIPSSETGSKFGLMEQIRQFKQSGKSLKRASVESGASNGTPTRVRKNSMQDALQTRFQAFRGYETESSSDEEDPNVDDNDWDD